MTKKKANKVMTSYLEQKEEIERKQAILKHALEHSKQKVGTERRKSAGLRNVNRPITNDGGMHSS